MWRNERREDIHMAMLAALGGERSDIWTTLPGIIESFNPETMTCEVQPAIQILYTSPIDGTKEWKTIPLCVDCPVQFPSAGGVTITFPIKNGDECIIQFSARCIDAWWQQGGIQPQPFIRMHDLSDGFVIPGIKSIPKVITNISTVEAQFRSDDGEAFVAVNPETHEIRVITSGDITAQADGNITAQADGDVSVTAGGSIEGEAGTFMSLTAPSGISLNGVQIDSAGNVTLPTGTTLLAPTVNGSTNVIIAGKSGKDHTHAQAIDSGGDSQPNVGPML